MSYRPHSLVIASLAAIVALVSSASQADDSLADKKFWTDQTSLIQDNINMANSRCGAHFTFDWVNKADLKTKTEAEHSSPFGTCLQALDLVGSICGKGDEEKKTVVKKITGVQCGYGKPHHLSLGGTKLDARLNVAEVNLSDHTTDELMHML